MERLPSVRQMQYLVALAQARNFGKAATQVGVTQSTLSASIKELEETLGGPVADRSGRQVHLTPLGEMVREAFERILAELTELTVLAREQAEPLGGSLRLGVIPTISPFLLPRLLPGLRMRYPKLRLYLREDQTAHLLEQLERGELDVLLLALPYACVGESEVIARDDFLVALRKDHPLAERSSVTPDDLRPETLLTLQDGHCLRDQVLSACGVAALPQPHVQNDGGSRRPAVTGRGYAATSLHTLVQMVDNGLGITLVPRMSLKAGLLDGTKLVTLPVKNAQAWRDIALFWRKGSARSEEMQLLADQLQRLIS